MTWKLKQHLRARLEREHGAIVKDWGGKRTIALVYPNTYSVGMGNLAVHALYRIFNNRPDIVCERVFLPSKDELEEYQRTATPILSIESQRQLAEFDIVAFSISFENDFLNILPILDLARIPHRATDRSQHAPLVIAGGAAVTLNPLPISKIFDAIVLGEVEGYANDLVPLLANAITKSEAINELAKLSGVFVPEVPKPKQRYLKTLNDWPTQTVIYSPQAQFGNMHLIEVQRGCPYRCRFCATPSLYAPPRQRSTAAILQMIEAGLPHRKKFGLIGPYILTHPDFFEIAEAIHSRGAQFSPSSVRVNDITDRHVKLLAKSGHRSIALGIEAGSERLRSTLHKDISDAEILDAAARLANSGITRLRLYFMIGLPEESDDDIFSIVSLARRVFATIVSHAPKTKRVADVSLTISPFIPKPGTPLANAPFAGEAAIKSKIRLLRKLIGERGGIRANFDSAQDAEIEAFLSRGREDSIEFLEEAFRTGRAIFGSQSAALLQRPLAQRL